LIDDSLVLDAGGLTSSLSLEAQLGIKAVLITHQHYDHIRDIIAFGENLFHSGVAADIYSISDVITIVTDHFFNSGIYRNLSEVPRENPTLRLNIIEPLQPFQVTDFEILAVPVKHSAPTVGYQVTSPDGKAVFYTSDTGPGLTDCWEQVSPQLLIVEVTNPNKFEETGHLTPNLLKRELIAFQRIKGYLPEVVTVHMNPSYEDEIRAELAVVAEELNSPVTVGYEGMEINL